MSYFILSYCNYIYSIHSARKRDTSTTMVYCLAEVNTEALLQLLAKGKHKFCQTVIHISSNETRLHEVTKINIESTSVVFSGSLANQTRNHMISCIFSLKCCWSEWCPKMVWVL